MATPVDPVDLRLTGRSQGTTRLTKRWAPNRPSPSWLELAIIALIAASVIYLLIVALWIRVDYYDAYLNLLNGRAIATGEGGQYSILRPILYPALLAPIFLVLERLDGAALAELVAAHLLGVLSFALFLFVTFKLFRLHLGRRWALMGVLVLSWNAILISQAPFAMDDIPGALFTVAAFFFYLRAKETGRLRHVLLAGVMIAAVMGTRYQLAPLPFAVIVSNEVLNQITRARLPTWRWHDGRVLAMRVICLFGLPVALFLLFPVIVYPLIHRGPGALGAPEQFIRDLRTLSASVPIAAGTPSLVGYRFLVESLTWPLLFCAALGGILGVRLRLPGTLFHLLWFAIFLGGLTYLFGLSACGTSSGFICLEARYLIAVFPPVYFFVARGLEAISGLALALPIGRTLRRAWAGPLIALLLLMVPAANVIAADARFADPVYGTDYGAQVTRFAEVVAGNRNIYWVGPPYSLHPHQYVFDADDPFTYIYDYYAFQATFWARRWVSPLAGFQVIVSDPAAPPFVYSGIANSLKEGDVLIVNQAPGSYHTRDMPQSLPPLEVEQVNTTAFTSTDAFDAAAQLFTSPAVPGTIRVRREGLEYAVEGQGVADGQYELYAAESDFGGLRSLRLLAVQGSSFRVSVPVADWPARSTPGKLVLLHYGPVIPFPAPGS